MVGPSSAKVKDSVLSSAKYTHRESSWVKCNGATGSRAWGTDGFIFTQKWVHGKGCPNCNDHSKAVKVNFNIKFHEN